MVPSDYIVSCLATQMFNEPKEDGLLGFTAAGLVIRNRVLAGWHGGDWLTLITKHDTFSAYPNGDFPRILKYGDPNRDILFRRCLGIAEQIYSGREKDITESAVWYGRLDDCSDDFKERIVRPLSQIGNASDGSCSEHEHPMVAKIGRQMFFK